MRFCTIVKMQLHILCAEKYGNMQLEFAYISLLVALRLLDYFCFFFFLFLPFFLPFPSLFLSISVASLLSESGYTGFNFQTPHRVVINSPVKRALLKGRFYF